MGIKVKIINEKLWKETIPYETSNGCTSLNLSECTRNIFRSCFLLYLFRYERQHPNNNMNIWANQNKIQILMLYHFNLFLFFFFPPFDCTSFFFFVSAAVRFDDHLSAYLSTNHWISIHLDYSTQTNEMQFKRKHSQNGSTNI